MILSRPQQIYVVPQANPANALNVGGHVRGMESMAWLQKRIHLLKDEMLIVEVQLERMKHEQILLKAHLKELEHLHDNLR